jgi:hypothetical protein
MKILLVFLALGLFLTSCAFIVDGGGVIVSTPPAYVYSNPYPYYGYWYGPYYYGYGYRYYYPYRYHHHHH